MSMSIPIYNGPTPAEFDAVAAFVQAIPADQFDMELCSTEPEATCGCVLFHSHRHWQRAEEINAVQRFAQRLQNHDKWSLFAYPLFSYGESYNTPKGEAGKQEFLTRLSQMKQKYCSKDTGL
jgi:hypothetical protein